jgi:hypothetical protein
LKYTVLCRTEFSSNIGSKYSVTSKPLSGEGHMNNG